MTEPLRAIDLAATDDPDPLYPRYPGQPLKPYTVVITLYDFGSGELETYHVEAPNSYEARLAVVQFMLQETRIEAMHHLRNSGTDAVVLEGHVPQVSVSQDPLWIGGRRWTADRLDEVRACIRTQNLPPSLLESLLNGVDASMQYYERLETLAAQNVQRMDDLYAQYDARRKQERRAMQGDPTRVFDASWIPPQELLTFPVTRVKVKSDNA